MTDAATHSGDRSSAWTARRAFVAALAAAAALSFTGIFDHSFWAPDESRVAQIGREMAHSGDYVVPTFLGEPFVEKPPLGWWAMAGIYRLFGVSAGAARSASALAGLLTLLLVFDVARRISTPFGGVMAVLAAGTMGEFHSSFHRILVDPWLACAVMLGYWGVAVAAFSREEGRPSPWAILTIYGAGGLAFLAKGPIGPALVGGPAFVAIVVGRRRGFFRSWAHVPGIFLSLGLCALWPFLLYRHGGKPLLDMFLIDNVVDRFLSRSADGDHGSHAQGTFYYLSKLPQITFPWLLVLPAVVHWLWRKRHPAEWNRPALLFVASVFPVGLLLLSVPGAKRQLYLLPLLAPLGVAVGVWLASALAGGRASRLDRGSQVVLLGVAGLALVGITGVVAILCLASREFLERYSIYMQSRPPLATVAALLASTVIAAAGLGVWAFRLWRRRAREAGPMVAATVLALFVLGGSLLFAVSDSHKTFRPFLAELKAAGGLSQDVAGYKLDEVTLGLLALEGGAMPRLTRAGDSLRRWAMDGVVGRLLVERDRLDDVPEAIRVRLRLVREWPCAKRRTYLLFDIGSALAKP